MYTNQQGFYQRPTPIDYKKPIRRSSNRISLVLISMNLFPLISVLIVRMADLLMPRAGMLDERTVAGQLVDIFIYLSMFLLPIILGLILLKMPAKYAFPMRKTPADILFSSIGFSMLLSVLGSILVLIVSESLIAVFGVAPVYPESVVPRGIPANILFFISVAVLPAILEEALFRGVIMQHLRRYGDMFALVISSLLFALAHGNLVQIPYAFLLGLLIGYFVLYSGSLIPGIVMHLVNNGTSVVVQWLTLKTSTSQDSLISLTLFSLRIIFGLGALIVFLMRRNRTPSVPKGSYPIKESSKYAGFFTAIATIIYLIYAIYQFIGNLQPV